MRRPPRETEMAMGARAGSLPSSPEMAVSPSWSMRPIHSLAVDNLNELFSVGRTATTSARAKGRAVEPTPRKRWPKAHTLPPSMQVTVPSAPTLKSPAMSCTLIIEPGLRSPGLPSPGPIFAPAATPWKGSNPSARSSPAKASTTPRLNPPKAMGVAMSNIRASPASTGRGFEKPPKRLRASSATEGPEDRAGGAPRPIISSMGRMPQMGSLE